ncbi:hypothetical protein PAEAM_38940 [Paenibacillus sp. GM1FR]|nr:hypothetical protein PAEAM_38940 [Paenibacillus sp. GM1FR]
MICWKNFNPRTPYRVRRGSAAVNRIYRSYFNPRTPYRVRPTLTIVGITGQIISIHALHTECDFDVISKIYLIEDISIHALHTECDFRAYIGDRFYNLFQSTHSIQSATITGKRVDFDTEISIHALHTECDDYRQASGL